MNETIEHQEKIDRKRVGSLKISRKFTKSSRNEKE